MESIVAFSLECANRSGEQLQEGTIYLIITDAFRLCMTNCDVVYALISIWSVPWTEESDWKHKKNPSPVPRHCNSRDELRYRPTSRFQAGAYRRKSGSEWKDRDIPYQYHETIL